MKNSSADFAVWLTHELTARGYDVANTRSGARARFAADSGLSPSTVSRLLRGYGATDIGTLTTLAKGLGIPLGEVLVRAGVLSREELDAVQHPPTGPRRITPEQAADELGIEDDQARRIFLGMVDTLRTPPPTERSAEH
ncbi:helix-turn-helix domain-containing protein [Streptomyces sp. enrichment culture]|uniref:helix-turn-helix domain-containing protein n=1 Tax=Streptomyces sp. enrichment culture TaxID=1795815 RepID=UPI003F5462F8